MKTTIKSITLIFALFLLSNTTSYAQKIAYLNYQALVAEMPEVKQARSSLETFQKQLQSKGQKMVESLQAEYQAIQGKVERGELSPVQQETEGKKLETKQREIAQYEQEMQQQIIQKEQSLLQPILTQVNDVISAVANEKGYQYVLDQSTGGILFTDKTGDITAEVKAKLGL